MSDLNKPVTVDDATPFGEDVARIGDRLTFIEPLYPTGRKQNTGSRNNGMKITLQDGDFGTYLLVAEDGQDRLIQTDWDFPGIASTFGWTPCSCGATDGTVACAHKQVGQMIAEAQAFLDDHIGDAVDDPGYFE